jgi:hypothetical protein
LPSSTALGFELLGVDAAVSKRGTPSLWAAILHPPIEVDAAITFWTRTLADGGVKARQEANSSEPFFDNDLTLPD